MKVTGLIVEKSAVRGVNVETAEGRESYRANAVVLADGGFESNGDMLRRFITPHPEHLHMRAPKSGNGDGMRLAEDAGGIEGGPEVGCLGGPIKALVFGLLAAEHHATMH